MSRKTRRYASALLSVLKEASQKEQKERIIRFLQLLKKRGDFKIVGQVMREFSKIWQEKDGEIAKMYVAKDEHHEVLERAIIKKGYTVEKEVEKRLLGGIAVFLGNHTMIDNSIKGRLERVGRMLNITL